MQCLFARHVSTLTSTFLIFLPGLAVSVRPLRIRRPQQHQCRSPLLLWCNQESHCCTEITSRGSQQDRNEKHLRIRWTNLSLYISTSIYVSLQRGSFQEWLFFRLSLSSCWCFFIRPHSEGSLHHTRRWDKDKERLNSAGRTEDKRRTKNKRRTKDKRRFHEMWVIRLLFTGKPAFNQLWHLWH